MGSWGRRTAGLGLCLLTACSGGAPKAASGDAAASSSPPVSQAVITATPKDASQDVPADAPVKVVVAQGRLVSVRLADSAGAALTGKIAPDGASWTFEGHLAPATPYTLDSVAEDAAGLRAAQHTAFTTVGPAHTFAAFFTPEDGSTVGVGMPVSLRFTRPIADRATVEQAVSVTADPPVPVVGHWFGSQRLDFRPEKYWAAGTKVTLALRLKDVQGAPGEYGTQAKEVHFTVGRAQVSVADLDAHTMTVRQDGRVLRTLRISGGSPEHSTYLGALVISEKYEVTRMNSQTVGMGDEYDIKDVPHAMRLTASGTFVHGNYWADRSVFGSANTSHGCIGLADAKGGSTDTPAGWFYTNSIIGDVIEVRGEDGDTVPPDNGLNDWNLPWAQWVKAGPAAPSATATAGPSASASPSGSASATAPGVH
ncbi:Ig-like domain-containing protein [Kitasatospora sp. NPDC002227]|uniref:L,D-transpeptidase n=1 Tax=Kitasatospora sp. NPDC002227 TaxID=3154773 RepID=UPI00332BDC05